MRLERAARRRARFAASSTTREPPRRPRLSPPPPRDPSPPPSFPCPSPAACPAFVRGPEDGRIQSAPSCHSRQHLLAPEDPIASGPASFALGTPPPEEDALVRRGREGHRVADPLADAGLHRSGQKGLDGWCAPGGGEAASSRERSRRHSAFQSGGGECQTWGRGEGGKISRGRGDETRLSRAPFCLAFIFVAATCFKSYFLDESDSTGD